MDFSNSIFYEMAFHQGEGLREDKNAVTPLKLDLFGYLIFTLSLWFLGFTLLLIIKHRKDEQFLYRSPTLVIAGFIAAFICQLISGLSLSFDDPNYKLTWIAGHVSQYFFYPFFCSCYITRALRLIILFERAEKGLYFSENDSTMPITATENDMDSLKSSTIHKPKTQNCFVRSYYWLLFRLETEIDYLVLTFIFALIPTILSVSFLIHSDFTTLRLVSYSHCLHSHSGGISNHVGLLVDILFMSFDLYIMTTIFVLLLPIRKDFR